MNTSDSPSGSPSAPTPAATPEASRDAVPDALAGLPAVRLRSPGGDQAIVLLHGAHVVSWITAGGGGLERLYLSPTSGFGAQAAIRGGVPVVFPQFNQRGPDTGLPKHGFARNRVWAVREQQADSVALRLEDDDATRAIWPHRFALDMTVTLTDGGLDMALAVSNIDSRPFSFTAALHTYLEVVDVTDAGVHGLEGVRLLDTVNGQTEVAATELLRFGAQTDRIYWNVPGPLTMTSPQGSLSVGMAGFNDAVIWNPWATLAAALPDMPDDDWRRMLCIEAAQIGEPVTLAAGASWVGRQTLTCLDAGE